MTSGKLRKQLSMILALILAISVMTASAFAAGSLGNFAGKRSYRWGQFSDVSENKWYGANQQAVIKSAYEFGLMEGNADGTFAPESNVLICQIITMAARIHNIYNGGTGVFPSGSPWYQPYVDYAVQNSIISADYGFDLSEPAPRWLVADIFARCIPERELPALTTITSLPDVDVNEYYNRFIVLLYEAGVLRGSDEFGTFHPYESITRAETAAIACRLVAPSLRKALEAPKYLVEGYSDQQIADYFVEIAFGGEYSGDNTKLCKWAGPIYVDIHGSLTADDWSQMDKLFDKLNSINGFPGIYYSSYYSVTPNLNVFYAPPSEFNQYLEGLPDESLWGYAQYSYYTSSRTIFEGTVLLPSEEANQWYRNSIICEELIQVLGLTQDSWLYPDSIFYQNSNDTQWPTELDWTVVRLLYDPSMQAGMTKDQARATALQLISSWK